MTIKCVACNNEFEKDGKKQVCESCKNKGYKYGIDFNGAFEVINSGRSLDSMMEDLNNNSFIYIGNKVYSTIEIKSITRFLK